MNFRLLSIVCISLLSTLSIYAQDSKAFAELMPPERKISYAARIIENFYIDSINSDKIVEEGIKAMLKQLDPHSVYSNAEETEELTTPLDGNFSGIGIQFQMLNDSLYIIQTISGGPSEKVGILPGDCILKADTTTISGASLTNSQITSMLRGPKGTQVDVKVLRNNQTIDFLITRDDIPVNSIDAAYLVYPTTGYIRLSRFGASSNEELQKALDRLSKQGMKRLILDLEDNGGGYLGTAVEIAGNFLSQGDLVTYTESSRGGFSTPFYVEKDGKYRNLPLVIMVNQYSASASEILSGAIQDHDRGVIVGRRTFGKGLVQRPFPFPDGSMIRLTISRYHTPSGRSIQKPYQAGNTEDYSRDLLNRYEAGELSDSTAIELPDSLLYHTLKKQRPVYGGGGIMPDKFIPIDTVGFTDYYRDLVAKSVINQHVLTYVNANREELQNKYPDSDIFIANFQVTDDMIDSIVALGEKSGVSPNPEQLETSRHIIETIVKGLTARDLFTIDTYFKVVQPILNPTYKEALHIISNPDIYNSHLLPTPN